MDLDQKGLDDKSCFKIRAIINDQGLRNSPGYYERGPRLLSKENRRKIELKEPISCLIPLQLLVFTQQLEILTTLKIQISAVVLLRSL